MARPLLVILLLLSLSIYAADRPAGVPSDARWVKVDRVTDGDTIVLVDRTRVRLHGIDAPEQDQPYGSAAPGTNSSIPTDFSVASLLIECC